MSDNEFTLKPTRMLTHPHTTRSRLMLEVASALVNRRDWPLLQARVSLREQGSDDWPLTLFGSDSPGTNAARYFLNPVYGLYAATSRQTLTGEPRGGWFAGERPTIEEAIEAATKNPAWASFEEHIKGTITVGKLADLAVFDTNLIEVGRTEPARLLKARVLYTIAGGTVVYERR